METSLVQKHVHYRSEHLSFANKKEHLSPCLVLVPAVFYSICCLTAIRNLFVISPVLGIHLEI